MSNTTDKFEKVIEDILTEKTFNLEIVERIKTLREDCKTLTEKNIDLKSRLDNLQEKYDTLNAVNNDNVSKLNAYSSREDVLREREQAVERNNYEKDFSVMRANELKELLCIIFKSPVYKREVSGEEQKVIENNGYPTTISTPFSKIERVSEE